MRTRTLLVALLLAIPLAGCGNDDGGESPPAHATPSLSDGPQALPSGKSEYPLSVNVDYASPEGFTPAVSFSVSTEGWVSTHRSTDAFDVSRPLPGADAPLEVVAFVVPAEASAKDAAQAIADRAAQAGAVVVREGGLTVTGGEGPLILSRDGGLALDAVPGGYARITTEDTVHGPVLKVLWVPDATNQALVDADHSIASTIQVN